MAVALHVYIKNKGAKDSDPIAVEHVFYGRDEAEADKIRLAHMAGCENYALAEAENRTAEDLEEGRGVELLTWEDVGSDEPSAAPDDEEDDGVDEEEEDDEELEADDEAEGDRESQLRRGSR